MSDTALMAFHTSCRRFAADLRIVGLKQAPLSSSLLLDMRLARWVLAVAHRTLDCDCYDPQTCTQQTPHLSQVVGRSGGS
jgi:hypothetical protein